MSQKSHRKVRVSTKSTSSSLSSWTVIDSGPFRLLVSKLRSSLNVTKEVVKKVNSVQQVSAWIDKNQLIIASDGLYVVFSNGDGYELHFEQTFSFYWQIAPMTGCDFCYIVTATDSTGLSWFFTVKYLEELQSFVQTPKFLPFPSGSHIIHADSCFIYASRIDGTNVSIMVNKPGLMDHFEEVYFFTLPQGNRQYQRCSTAVKQKDSLTVYFLDSLSLNLHIICIDDSGNLEFHHNYSIKLPSSFSENDCCTISLIFEESDLFLLVGNYFSSKLLLVSTTGGFCEEIIDLKAYKVGGIVELKTISTTQDIFVVGKFDKLLRLSVTS